MYRSLKNNEKKLVKVRFAKSSFEYIFRKKNQQEMDTYGQKPI